MPQTDCDSHGDLGEPWSSHAGERGGHRDALCLFYPVLTWPRFSRQSWELIDRRAPGSEEGESDRRFGAWPRVNSCPPAGCIIDGCAVNF